MNYSEEITRSMTWLAEKNDTIFLGQAVKCFGTFMSHTLTNVPEYKKLELPVMESFQLQYSLGLAIDGLFPITIFPRLNFFLLAISDLVNTIDKIPIISDYKILPKMIIRTAFGPSIKSFPGWQHTGEFTRPIKQMLTWVDVIEANSVEEVFNIYKYAYERPDGKATLVAEIGDLY